MGLASAISASWRFFENKRRINKMGVKRIEGQLLARRGGKGKPSHKGPYEGQTKLQVPSTPRCAAPPPVGNQVHSTNDCSTRLGSLRLAAALFARPLKPRTPRKLEREGGHFY